MEEDEEEMKQEIENQYKEVLRVDERDNGLVCALLKLSKIQNEILAISNCYHGDCCDLDAYEALVRMDVLLGAVGEVRKDIKALL